MEFDLMKFGRHLQQVSNESLLVFDSLCIVPESLAQKTLYVSLKLLPPPIRYLLNFCNHLLFSDYSFLLTAIALPYQSAVIIQFLLPKNLLDLTDLFLNKAGDFFIDACSLQFWIIA